MKINKLVFLTIFGGALTSFHYIGHAKSVGTSAGLTLLEAAGARPTALGEAFTAIHNDITGMSYNPASLGTLESGQASFSFQKGLIEDSYGQLLLGVPSGHGGMGLSVGYYDGGDLPVLKNGIEATVVAQRDFTISGIYSRKVKSASLGLTAKYLSSELAETAKASAFAADIGLSLPLHSRARLGAAVQNIGSSLKYIDEGDSLPRMARGGLSILFPRLLNTTLLLDGVYLMNEKEVRPGAGLEMWVGPLALRAGYRGGSDLQKFSVGTGFIFGPSSLDYSFGFTETLDPRHQVSLAFRFGAASMTPPLVKKPEVQKQEKERLAFEIKEDPIKEVQDVKNPQRHTLGGKPTERPSFSKTTNKGVYTVKPGDSLASIAKKVYGNPKMWRTIYSANSHLIGGNPRDISAGQKIILP